MARQIVLDTETTGIGEGHRIIEIGCVVIQDRVVTNEHFHVYLNPERAVDAGAFKVHGISDEFLKDKPKFASVFQNFYEFVKNSEIIIHNAAFDTGFINREFNLLGKNIKIEDFCPVTCTWLMAKKKHPGQKNNLDALCTRYHVDNSGRQLHGALLDAEILAEVYLAMTGGQTSLFSEEDPFATKAIDTKDFVFPELQSKIGKILEASEAEKLSHQEMVNLLVKKSGINLWENIEE